MIGIQLDTGESIGVELEAVRSIPTHKSRSGADTGDLGVREEGVVTVATYQRGAVVLGTMLSAPVPAEINWSDSVPIRPVRVLRVAISVGETCVEEDTAGHRLEVEIRQPIVSAPRQFASRPRPVRVCLSG